ncbi:hypothetical protein [Cupriavidus lacunae]|uniref:hypothetical protein n=1 Tax=Cupriavidus lacunae TaxID=2666307 RepID=UPI0010589D05|nr:hypothetical protein [Cupriavidus lacunae]
MPLTIGPENLAYPDGCIIGKIKSINTMLVYWRSPPLFSLQFIGVAAPSIHAVFRSAPTENQQLADSVIHCIRRCADRDTGMVAGKRIVSLQKELSIVH